MEIEFQLTKEEYLLFFKSYFRNSLGKKISWSLSIAIIISFLLSIDHFTWLKLLLYFGSVFSLLILVYRIVPDIISIRKWMKRAEYVTNALQKKKIFVYQEGLGIQTSEKSETIPWENLLSVSYLEKIVYLFFKNKTILLIPARAFISLSEQQNFQRILFYEIEKHKGNPVHSKKQKILWHLRWVLPVLFFFFIFRGCIIAQFDNFKEHNLSKEEFALRRKEAVTECKSLFKLRKRDSLLDYYSIFPTEFNITKSQYPFCNFNYGDYYVEIHKVNVPESKSLQGLSSVEKRQDKLDISYFGGGWGGDNMVKFRYALGDSFAREIIISHNGELLYADSTEKLVNYNLLAKKIAFRYGVDQDVNFSFALESAGYYGGFDLKINADISLYRKEKSVYIIVMYPKGPKKSIDKLLLANLLEDQ